MSITNIIFENCKENENYGYGMYGNFTVIIMKKNGYINATKLCEQGNKRFDNWLSNISSKKLMETIKNIIQDENENENEIDVQINIRNIHNNLRGTYVHQDLIPHIASWVSSEFAVKVSKIVNNYMMREYKMKNDELTIEIKNINKIMTKMQRTLDLTYDQNEELKQQNDELKRQTDELKRQNDHTHKQNDKLTKKMTTLQVQNTEIQTALEKSLEDRVPKTKSKTKDEYFAVIKNPFGSYYVIRRQRCSVKNAIKNYMITNKGSKLIYISWNPNAVNNFNRMKEKEYINKVIINGNTLRLRNISETDLIQMLYKVNDDKYDQKKQRQMDNYIEKMVDNFNIEEDSDEEEEELYENENENENENDSESDE